MIIIPLKKKAQMCLKLNAHAFGCFAHAFPISDLSDGDPKTISEALGDP